MSEKTIYRWAWSQDLPSIRLSPKALRFQASAVEQWVAKRASAA